MRRRVALFTPAFKQLVALLRGRVRFPPDWDSWEQDDRDDFKHARQDVSDALLDAAGASPHGPCTTLPLNVLLQRVCLSSNSSSKAIVSSHTSIYLAASPLL